MTPTSSRSPDITVRLRCWSTAGNNDARPEHHLSKLDRTRSGCALATIAVEPVIGAGTAAHCSMARFTRSSVAPKAPAKSP